MMIEEEGAADEVEVALSPAGKQPDHLRRRPPTPTARIIPGSSFDLNFVPSGRAEEAEDEVTARLPAASLFLFRCLSAL